jgi:protocatechuate 3,4-dioxygenase beta subunit
MKGLRGAIVIWLLAAGTVNAQSRPGPIAAPAPQAASAEDAPTGVIWGRIYGANGRPLFRAQVQLVRADSGRSLGFVSTDEGGRYEFASLAAEDYRVTAGKSGYLVTEYGQRRAFERGTPITLADGGTLEKIDITLPSSGAIMGRISDENGEPVEGAMVQLFQMRFADGRRQLVAVPGVAVRTSNDLGRYRLFGIPPGEYVVSAATNLTVSRNVIDGVPGQAPVYAPGTPNAAEARTVNVDLSQEVSDVDVVFLPIPTARIAGSVVDSTGAPLRSNGTFTLSATQRSGALAPAPMRGTIRRDGAFEIKNVAPGDYVLHVSGQRPRDETEGEFAAQFITVSGRDIDHLQVRTSAGSRLAGRVRFEGLPASAPGAELAKLNARLSVEVTALPVDLDRSALRGSFARHRTNPTEGMFDLRGLTGPRLIRLTREPAGWALKAVLVNGTDVTDTPLSFGTQAESLEDVEIVLSQRIAEVSGRLVDSRGQPATGYVAAFATDRDRWGLWSRFVKFGRSLPDGSFTIAGLPAGDYHVVAVDRLLEGIGEWQDPEVLESVSGSSVRITLAEGQKASVNPRLIIR